IELWRCRPTSLPSRKRTQCRPWKSDNDSWMLSLLRSTCAVRSLPGRRTAGRSLTLHVVLGYLDLGLAHLSQIDGSPKLQRRADRLVLVDGVKVKIVVAIIRHPQVGPLRHDHRVVGGPGTTVMLSAGHGLGAGAAKHDHRCRQNTRHHRHADVLPGCFHCMCLMGLKRSMSSAARLRE